MARAELLMGVCTWASELSICVSFVSRLADTAYRSLAPHGGVERARTHG
jgi:hypothetical protein